MASSWSGEVRSHIHTVVARELGIPAIVGIPGLTEILQDGEHVKMDGETGIVHTVSPQSPQDATDSRETKR